MCRKTSTKIEIHPDACNTQVCAFMIQGGLIGVCVAGGRADGRLRLHRAMLVRVPVAWAMKLGGVVCGGGMVAGAIERGRGEGRWQ